MLLYSLRQLINDLTGVEILCVGSLLQLVVGLLQFYIFCFVIAESRFSKMYAATANAVSRRPAL